MQKMMTSFNCVHVSFLFLSLSSVVLISREDWRRKKKIRLMIRSISERENGSDAVGRLFTSWPQSRAINIMQQDGLGVLCVTRENSRGETRANNRLYFRQLLDHSHHTSSKCFLLFCREKGKELTPPPPPPLSRRLRPGRKDFLQKEGENS